MANNKIAKTLLIIWADIPNYCEILEQKIYQNALCSYNNPNATEKIIDRIIDIAVRKDILKNLSKELERVVSGLPPRQQTILHNHYCHKQKTATEVTTEMGISVRSFYRHLNSAVDSVTKQLDSMGINSFSWGFITDQNSWIKNVYLEQAE
jgi:DNA-directed RNA polymerase specialized sigma subunit